ncbi:hypothetical protein ACKFKG_15255 [Phormidesmis sp. 146-35]
MAIAINQQIEGNSQIMNDSPIEDTDTAIGSSVAELKSQLDVTNAESEAATQELLAIPGLLERVKQNQATQKTLYTSWKTLRSDV